MKSSLQIFGIEKRKHFRRSDFLEHKGMCWDRFSQECIINNFLNSDWIRPTSLDGIYYSREFIEEEIFSKKYFESDDDPKHEKIFLVSESDTASYERAMKEMIKINEAKKISSDAKTLAECKEKGFNLLEAKREIITLETRMKLLTGAINL
jgi:hypothetical protein